MSVGFIVVKSCNCSFLCLQHTYYAEAHMATHFPQATRELHTCFSLLSHSSLLAWGFSKGSVGKESACARVTGDVGLNPGSGRSPGGGHGNPFQYSCLGNPMDRGTWWATVHGVKKSGTQLSNWALLAYLSCLTSSYSLFSLLLPWLLALFFLSKQ